MKATELIKNAIESRLGLSENDYKVLHMARVYDVAYDVAIILVNSTCSAYVIRTWKARCSKIRQITRYETYEEVFNNFLTLKE